MEQHDIPFATLGRTRRATPRLDAARAALGLSFVALAVVVAGMIVLGYDGPREVQRFLGMLAAALTMAGAVVSVANIRRAPATIALTLNAVTLWWAVKLLYF